jgi:molybdate transport system substrate-binding protein
MRKFALVLSILLAVVQASRAETITVAAAVSLKEAVTEISQAYQAESGDKVEFTFGSSGQLMAQIKSGAPIDVFISAANKQMDDLMKDGLIDNSTRRIIAGNELVLIVPSNADNSVNDFKSLAKDSVKKIAIGEPKTVPAGQYADQVIAKLELNIKDKLVFGTNVRQVLDYVERGEVSAGIVYATDAKQSGDKVKVVAVAEPSTHEQIVYPSVVVKASAKQTAAKKFLDYLGTEKAIAVLKSKGFTIPADPP